MNTKLKIMAILLIAVFASTAAFSAYAEDGPVTREQIQEQVKKVKALERLIDARGQYGRFVVNGIYHNETAAKVAELQQARGLLDQMQAQFDQMQAQ